MPIVEILIKKDLHQIACADGEEQKVSLIANKLKEKIERLNAQFPSATDKTLYLMASLMVIDEMEDHKRPATNIEENLVIQTLDNVSERIEKLTRHLENDTQNVI